MPETYLEFEPSKDDLRKLREWLMKMPHLPQDYDDRFLSAFIRGCKGSLQKTKLVLENFNCLGMKYPELFGNLDPLSPILQEHLNSTRIFPLPRKSQDGSTILMGTFRPDYEDRPYEVHTVEFYRYWLQTLYIQIWENEFEAGKYIVLWDLRHSSLTHVRDLTPVVIKQLLEVLKTSVPVRLQAIHCLYVPPFLEWLVNFAKSIAKQKLASRIFVHSTLETCYKQVPKELFPKEYGGSQDSINALHERWKKKAESYRSNLIKEEIKMRGLYPLRPKEEDADEMSGTFRMLTVD